MSREIDTPQNINLIDNEALSGEGDREMVHPDLPSDLGVGPIRPENSVQATRIEGQGKFVARDAGSSESREEYTQPKSATDALAGAIKAAVDEGNFELASALIDVARKAKPLPVTKLEDVRSRRDK